MRWRNEKGAVPLLHRGKTGDSEVQKKEKGGSEVKKIMLIILIVVGVVITYLVMAAIQPAVNDIISTANASANWTGFESTQAAVNSYPIYCWFLPGIVGLVAIVVVVRSGKG